MSRADDRTDRLLQAYYTHAPVEPGMAARLAALASMDQGRVPVFGSRKTPLLLGAVMGVAFSALGALAYQQYVVPSKDPKSHLASAPFAGEKEVRLVALRFQVDWCPLSQATAPVFTDLVMKYGNRPVQFVVYNMTDGAQEAVSKKMARRIGVEWIPASPSNSGKVFLVDPDRHVVYETLKTPEDRDRWAEALERELVH